MPVSDFRSFTFRDADAGGRQFNPGIGLLFASLPCNLFFPCIQRKRKQRSMCRFAGARGESVKCHIGFWRAPKVKVALFLIPLASNGLCFQRAVVVLAA